MIQYEYTPVLGHAAVLLPAEAGEAGDRVSATRGEAAEAHPTRPCRLPQHSGIHL